MNSGLPLIPYIKGDLPKRCSTLSGSIAITNNKLSENKDDNIIVRFILISLCFIALYGRKIYFILP